MFVVVQRCFHLSSSLWSAAGLVQHRPVEANRADMKWEFQESNMTKVKEIMAKFPTNYKASAVMPLLVGNDTGGHTEAVAIHPPPP